MNARVWILGAIAAVALAVGPQLRASAAEGREAATKAQGPYVVVVGVGEFKDKAISPRPTADADAKALHAMLTDKKYLGASADRAKLLLSADATREAVVKAVETAVASTGPEDTVILAFFGRGTSAGDKPCIFTSDSTVKERAKTALQITDLEPAFKKLKNQNVLLMMDIQYRGGIDAGTEKIVEPSWGEIMKLVFGDEKDDNMLPPNRVLVLGNPPFQDALTKGDHGLFYSVLSAGLGGKADQAPYNEGYESDGIVTTRELLKYLEKEIPTAARATGKTDKEKELEPVFVGRGASKFWVTRNPAETATVKKRIETVEALTKDTKLTPDLAKEAVTLLFQMPKLKWSQALRKEYQKLADGGTVADLEGARKKLLEGLKLPTEDATEFAKKVAPAISKLSAEYIKPLSRGELTALAIRGVFTEADEAIPADIADALKAPKDISDERGRELLVEARLRLGKREDLDGEKAADVTIRALIGALHDPYAGYFTKEEWLRTQGQLFGRFPGVGIIIRREAVRDGLLVVTPIKGSPAFRAGIQAGDLITEIRLEVDKQGKVLPDDAKKVHSTKGLKTDDAVNLITGKPDTPVALVVQREGESEPKVFRLTRNYVMVETVHGVKRDDKNDWSYYIDEKSKIGYLHLSQFISISDDLGTTADIKRALASMKRSGLNGLVIDVRNNPGGSLKGVIDICELFVGREAIVTTKERGGAGAVNTYSGRAAGDKSFPIVVLINGNSASASEILAACLQDHSRATIIGERTYGKGSVQHVEPYEQTEGRIKYTVARYYPPSGRNIDKVAMEQSTELKAKDEWGVKPDAGFEIKLTREELTDWFEYSRDLEIIPPAGKKVPVVDPAKDKQLAKAVEHLRGLIKDKK
ncbi:S41 family peptidase [Gemmata sp. G18]|uniref:S41 family peptidase n=1 Tax=Gemmata palustris TaxID=2822762 RepID=A0ABS5C2X4_9BACT|nr:S41 family peptidase [Gemmata palustris]MBP3960329.1 S41 family peptidase [Gemmata palustris]